MVYSKQEYAGRYRPLTEKESFFGKASLVMVVILFAYMIYDFIGQARDIRNRVRGVQEFDLQLYLDCHEWRVHSDVGDFIVGCDAMTGLNYTTVEQYIWQADLHRELECTKVSNTRGYKGALPNQCWRGPLGTFNNYADISPSTAGAYLKCLSSNVKSWPRTSNTDFMRLCDPVIPATYEILMERYRVKAGQSTLSKWKQM